MIRAILRYDPALSRPQSWRTALTLDGPGIEARIRVGSAPEHAVELALRCKRPNKRARHVRRIDSETFLVESSVLHTDLPRLELLLAGAPPHAAEELSLM